MVLDDLYCGNIYPAEQVVPHEKEYRKLHRHTGELLTELEEKLSKEQMELVNQFHTHVIDVHCMELEAHFQYGFSLGLMLMKEVYALLENAKGKRMNIGEINTRLTEHIKDFSVKSLGYKQIKLFLSDIDGVEIENCDCILK